MLALLLLSLVKQHVIPNHFVSPFASWLLQELVILDGKPADAEAVETLELIQLNCKCNSNIFNGQERKREK